MNTLLLADLDVFVDSYVATALWSTCDDSGDPLDQSYSRRDISHETLSIMRMDCAKFLSSLSPDCFRVVSGDLASAGHYFWLTRNGHGSGFWDGDWKDGEELTKFTHRFREFNLYVGDDGVIYAS